MNTTKVGYLGISVALLLGAGCRGGSGGDGGGGGGNGGQPPLSDATELVCPNPGALPFATAVHDFASEETKAVAEGSPRNKDEASDTLGVPGGVRANTYIPVTEAPSAGDPVYDGRKARTGQASGLTAVGLGKEPTSLWYYDPTAKAWQTLGRVDTDADGNYGISPADAIVTERDRPVYSILEADGSCAEHYNYLMPEGTKFVVTDIDGTLTLSDDELFKQIDDGSYVPAQNKSADVLMNTWHDKGYFIVYLTARPHEFRSETRAWLRDLGFPKGPVVTANSLVFDESAREYKRAWINRMLTDFKWDVVAAYGNAASDVDAYEDAGIPKDITFTVGEAAGANGTTAVPNNDFTNHISDYVALQPDL